MFAVCVDKLTGRILHDIHIFDVENPQRIAADNSYATPTSVIDRERVYLHYGTYGTACLDSKTCRILWTRRDLNCDHESGAGPASSPMLVGNLFIVNVDGLDVQYVIALDKTNGKPVWKTTRSVDYSEARVNERKAYSMPIVIPRGEGTQLVMAFPLQTDPVFMRDSHPGEARKGFFEDEEDTAHDRSDY